MAKFLLNIPDCQMKALRELKDRTGEPMAHFLRQGLWELLSGHTSGGVTSGWCGVAYSSGTKGS